MKIRYVQWQRLNHYSYSWSNGKKTAIKVIPYLVNCCGSGNYQKIDQRKNINTQIEECYQQGKKMQAFEPVNGFKIYYGDMNSYNKEKLGAVLYESLQF